MVCSVKWISFLLCMIVPINGDTVRLHDIKKAIHGLGLMMEKTWPPNNREAERKPVFELYTCLSLTKDLELLVFNRTEIFIEDERQTCTCRRVHGKLQNNLSENSTFTTDLFIRLLVNTITNYEDSESLSQSFTHFNNEWLSSKKNSSHVHVLRDVLVKLTETENAIQILTRFVVKRWAINIMKDLFVPIFELYTCSSLLREAESYVRDHPNVLRYLNIKRGKWYLPCTCHRLHEIAETFCDSPQHCSAAFSPVHTSYEERIHHIIKGMKLPPEISL